MATSSNLVRLAFIAESTYGVTPGAGNFSTARFISETLSGTPDTTESQQIRTDRLSSGQIVTGLQVGGGLNFEFAKESQLEDFIASAMCSTWDVKAPVTVDLEVDVTAKKIIRTTGSFLTDGLVKGDFFKLDGFTEEGNNTVLMVTNVTALELTVEMPSTMVDETGTGTSYQRGDKIAIGTTKKSFSMEKAFTDLTTKAIVYKGMMVSQMQLKIAYGSLISGSLTFVGNSHSTADSAGEFITNGRTINAPATSQTFNGSIDMPFATTDVFGSFSQTGLEVQSIDLSLNNNQNPQTVIGNAAPRDYTLGTAQISISLNSYLTNGGWGVLAKKLTQDPFALGFAVQNNGGWYGFYLPAIQVSFEDPASAGQNQDVMLEMKGTAKVGAAGEKSMTIYRGV